ncbi:hypothetical protein CA54_37130 [Symmachiella macrocystis]|uniref:ABC-2 family transporter protein n=1 Tax=Symmachiella macrocystis TaxID=2527985 RepID=A0A5C6BRH5_9PLAN|nr:hypothetical protein [Symmachiella macrocystis]TWU14843.1 hypothetical protein CA54_37130 [Symmachiella macrocystis]
MIRGTMALMDRALRVDSRSLRAHLVRFLFVGMIVWCLILSAMQAWSTSAPGLDFLIPMLMITLLLITLGGVSLFATAITEEKEEMTLGLLQMAGVGPASLLLGKGVTRIVIALLILAAQFPFMLLAITLGGVLIHQVWAAYLAICAYLLMIGNAGLLMSVICKTSRLACFSMTVLLLIMFFGPWVLSSILAAAINVGTVAPEGAFAVNADVLLQKISAANIFLRITVILHSSFNEPLISFQVVFHTIAALVLFVLAWLLFDVFNREERAAAAERPLFGRRVGKTRWIAVPRTWRNALLWKDFFYAAGGWQRMAVKVVLYGAMIASIAIFIEVTDTTPSIFPSAEILGNTAIWVSLVMLFAELCFYCSRIFRDEIRNRTLSSLVMLPISIPEIVYSKWAGCLLATVPALGYFVAGVILYPDDFADFVQDALEEPWFYYTVMQFVVGYHLCTLFSMFIKYGAVALAIALVFVGNILMISTIEALTTGFSNGDEFAILGCMGSMVLTAFLHLAVIFRMQVMATR